jgi:hypothetical protein
MSAPSLETAQAWQGRTMVDPAGDKLGTIDAIYLDDETGQPEWATVTSGLFTAKAAFVPLMELTEMVDTPGLQPGRRPRDRAAAGQDGQAAPGDPAPR